MITVGISGAMGRMGVQLIKLVQADADLKLGAAIERADFPGIGGDVGILQGAGPLGVNLSAQVPPGLDVLIDFSTPDGVAKLIDPCVATRTAMVIGTTGIESLKPKLAEAAAAIPILASPNMSVGVNLVFRIAAEIARSLGIDYDIEVVEAHHRFKKDAPSGTALKIADEIAKATGRSLDEQAVFGRHGKPLDRKPGEIGIHAVRCGDIVGEHTVIYATLGERVELKHVAHSRETFARGALRAAKSIAGRKPGQYSIADIL